MPHSCRHPPPRPPARPNTTLFVGDLPPYWATADLLDFFAQFGEVLEARVIGSQVGAGAGAGSRKRVASVSCVGGVVGATSARVHGSVSVTAAVLVACRVACVAWRGIRQCVAMFAMVLCRAGREVAQPGPPTHPPPACQCYGFVKYATLADAEGMLEFAQQQGVWADERMLRINWAQGSMPEWKVGGLGAAVE